MITPKRRNLFFKFKGLIVFNSDSYNLIGVDTHPRYRVLPESLSEITSWSRSSKSLTGGYAFDSESGLYLKNIDNMSKEEADSDFSAMKLIPPFGFIDRKSYSEYVFKTFSDSYQGQLKKRYEALSSGNDKEAFVFYYTSVTTKTTDENTKSFVKITYDS